VGHTDGVYPEYATTQVAWTGVRAAIDAISIFFATLAGVGVTPHPARLAFGRRHLHSEQVDVTETDVAGLPPGNVRAPRDEFVAVWQAASARHNAAAADWYAAAVATTCRWLATAPARLPNGVGGLVRSPATRREVVAYEELIEAEYLAAEVLEQRRPSLARSRPGWCEGVRDTLRWAWRREGPAPTNVPQPQVAG
jgi:hypothetical protein